MAEKLNYFAKLGVKIFFVIEKIFSFVFNLVKSSTRERIEEDLKF